MNKKPIKIIKIKFTKKEQEEIDKIKNGEPMPITKLVTNKNGYTYEYTTNKVFSYEMGRKRLVQLYKGLCTFCRDYPVYRVVHDVSDGIQAAKLIERYCQKCYDRWEHRLKK